MATVEFFQNNRKKRLGETTEYQSEQMAGYVYSKKGRLIFRKEGMRGVHKCSTGPSQRREKKDFTHETQGKPHNESTRPMLDNNNIPILRNTL